MNAALNALLQEAIECHRQGRLDNARAGYAQILARDPRHPDALHLLGVLESQQGNYGDAVDLMDRALAAAPGNPACLSNRGLALKALLRHDEAAESFAAAIAINPDYAEAHSGRGLALQALGRLDDSVECFDRAIAIRPDFVEAHYNRGNALQELGLLDDAVESYERALAQRPALAEAWYNRGLALRALKRPDAALESLERARALRPDFEFLPGHRLLARLDLCDWQGLDADVSEMTAAVERGERVVPPFALLALCDSPALQRRAAQIYVGAKHPRDDSLGGFAPAASSERIRVGYFSADFRNHPVSYLTVGLFESHDRARFETIGFSLGPRSLDEMHTRVSAAFDRFVEAGTLGDREIARTARDLRLDIAVDLGGHTHGARTGVFALRAAPVQASYAGYLGTLGAEYFDYLFADALIVPAASRRHYSERIIELPCYQVNDSRRQISTRRFAREEEGLPAGGFVFCCFNNAYKINPRTFERWMRILRAVDESVLWLHVPHETAKANLRAAASSQGVDPSRLVFAKALPRPEYLARFALADLFLDTLPYNAGTVASDALWAGLPLLTLAGDSFAARIAASVLEAAGLSELVTGSEAEYVSRAIAVARDPDEARRLKAKVETIRRDSPLFDARQFARAIESAYEAMHARRLAGLPPDHIRVDVRIRPWISN